MKATMFGIAILITVWVAACVTAIQAALISFLLNFAWPELVSILQVWCVLLAICVLLLPVVLPLIWECVTEVAAEIQRRGQEK